MIQNECMKAADVGKHIGVKQRTDEWASDKADEIKNILTAKPLEGAHKASRNQQHPISFDVTVLLALTAGKWIACCLSLSPA